ncbi:MAG: aldehyde dehydrogenase family protein, partial [Pseudonocardia sp.]
MTTPAQLRHLVDGQWLDGAGDTIASTNPAEPNVVVAQGRLAETTELDGAVAAAQRVKREWARTPAHERGAILVRAAAIVENAAQDWGTELAREEGKTKPEGIGEVLRAAQILRYYGNDADRDAGEVFSSPRRGERILVTRKPIGVVGVITPFNFPIAIPTWKIAPALTYGNTVVWKPASTVPLLAMRL